jgi:Fic family protein
MLKYVEKDAWHRGKYKQVDNAVTATTPDGVTVGTVFATTPPYLTPKAMEELVSWTQRSLAEAKHHPLLVIGSAMVEFLAIHPFQDGNGRLSRLLTNLLLLRAGYTYVPYVSHEKLIEHEKRSYYIALRSAQKTFGTKHETIVPWLSFLLRALERQAEQAIALLSRTSMEQQLSEKQLAVLRHVERTHEASTSTIAAALKIARPTVVQALAKLHRLKLIDRIGLGRSTRYRRASL